VGSGNKVGGCVNLAVRSACFTAANTLSTCLHLHGTGGERDDDRDLETQLVLLDETRSTGYSWLLHGHANRHPRAGSPVRSPPEYL
jgi:hypothetical protein